MFLLSMNYLKIEKPIYCYMVKYVSNIEDLLLNTDIIKNNISV